MDAGRVCARETLQLDTQTHSPMHAQTRAHARDGSAGKNDVVAWGGAMGGRDRGLTGLIERGPPNRMGGLPPVASAADPKTKTFTAASIALVVLPVAALHTLHAANAPFTVAKP